MENFVVAVFRDYDQARLAAEDLERAGFSPADVQLSPEVGNASTGQDGAGTAMPDDDAAPRSYCVLSVEAGGDARRAQVLEILQGHEPIDVDVRVSHWTDEGWKGVSEPAPGGPARRAAGEGASPSAGGRQRG